MLQHKCPQLDTRIKQIKANLALTFIGIKEKGVGDLKFIQSVPKANALSIGDQWILPTIKQNSRWRISANAVKWTGRFQLAFINTKLIQQRHKLVSTGFHKIHPLPLSIQVVNRVPEEAR